jgi:short-subunit dehydrogenase
VPTAVTYCAAKFCVSTFTEGLAWELKLKNEDILQDAGKIKR